MANKKENTYNQEWITVKGARTHNLKDITLKIPRNKMTCITGLSGSGKSSLAFDTIFAEGQRRYVESLSTYARQFLNQMSKPDVDEITGLSPAISIDQKTRSNNPRSTVATITEIYDYLRILFARVGQPFSPISGLRIQKLSNQEILDFVFKLVEKHQDPKKAKKIMGVTVDEMQIHITAPVIRGRKGEHYQLLYDMLNKGYGYAKVDGEMKNLRNQIKLSKTKKHDIDFVVDSFAVHEFADNPDDVRLRLGEAVEKAIDESEGMIKIYIETENRKAIDEVLLSAKLVCPEDGYVFPEIEPRLFSFNSPYGACPTCNGLGTKHMFGEDVCPECMGARLRPEALQVFIGKYDKDGNVEDTEEGRKNIDTFVDMKIEEAYAFMAEIDLTEKEQKIAAPLLREIENRLEFLMSVGLEYLSLGRKAHTLSGGESQRIRLASQLGSQLVGALYVLDEPTIGLHARDNARLIRTLRELTDKGNTIIVVEHDEETIHASDYLIEIGPGAGEHGGEVIVADELSKLLKSKTAIKKSLTLQYLTGEKTVSLPERRRTKDKGGIELLGIVHNNLKNINVEIPLNKLTVIAGVSGSGKSSFMHGVLAKNMEARLSRRKKSNEVIRAHTAHGFGQISRGIVLDQSPIGRTPRSNPATYTGAFDHIRDLFAETTEAQIRGWKAGRFSFNTKGGRCEACAGRGEVAVEMGFLPTVYVLCDICMGSRYERETLEVKFKGKNISDVLNMTIEEAQEFFKDIPAINDRLKTLLETGLGYLRLGQPANTLSGGESQRVKISSELYRPQLDKTLYLLDEPTVGLHFEDVNKLIDIVQRLVNKGNTVVVIEHNMDLIKCADHIIDFGPKSGDEGGKVVAKGTPENIADNKKSVTGEFLKKHL
ncbi:MAG: excinuclease ABC subunit UvrA [Candidatus Pacebacteria bacterium]|nr:excinuclease ABC subunit UvrA [Candidatus Paceibacterota bacterium]